MAKPEDLFGTWTMLSWQKQTVGTGQTIDATVLIRLATSLTARMAGCMQS